MLIENYKQNFITDYFDTKFVSLYHANKDIVINNNILRTHAGKKTLLSFNHNINEFNFNDYKYVDKIVFFNLTTKPEEQYDDFKISRIHKDTHISWIIDKEFIDSFTKPGRTNRHRRACLECQNILDIKKECNPNDFKALTKQWLEETKKFMQSTASWDNHYITCPERQEFINKNEIKEYFFYDKTNNKLVCYSIWGLTDSGEIIIMYRKAVQEFHRELTRFCDYYALKDIWNSDWHKTENLIAHTGESSSGFGKFKMLKYPSVATERWYTVFDNSNVQKQQEEQTQTQQNQPKQKSLF